MDKTILHCDCNGFYASVECILNPELNHVPMAVGGNPKNRHGIILAKNELAKKCGIVTAETIWQATKKCPELVIVPPQHREYAKYSKIVNNIYYKYTDLIEPFGIDESYLDVTDVQNIFGDGKTIADMIRKEVREEVGLTISVGVSFNKVFAKLGSDYKKPDATTVINRENYKELLYPLPASDLLFVGRKVKQTLARLSIKTIGDLAESDKNVLIQQMGKIGEMIWIYANGLGDDNVKPFEEFDDTKSVGNGMTFKRDIKSLHDAKIGIIALSDEVAIRLRKYGIKCKGVQISIKDTDFKTTSRQMTLHTPTHLAKTISDAAISLITNHWDFKKPIRTLTVTGIQIIDDDMATVQMSIFDDKNMAENEKQEKLEFALDKIRDKYGRGSIMLGGILKNDLGIDDHTVD